MKKSTFTLLLLSIFLSGSPELFAQQAVLSSGGEASGTGGSSAYSIGQIAYQTNGGTAGAVAQGVQQPQEIYKTTGIGVNAKLFDVSIFPNPTDNYLILRYSSLQKHSCQFSLFDLNGKLLMKRVIRNRETLINMIPFEPASYLITISAGDRQTHSFKIIKN